MKKLLAVSIFLSFSGLVQAACQNPINPKKVVLMVSFHDGSEEEKGAIEGACARGEKLVVLPKIDPERTRIRTQINAMETESDNLYRRLYQCTTEACNTQIETEMAQLNTRAEQLFARLDAAKPDLEKDMKAFLEASNANGTKVTSLILSGHDGGGHYYGDYGETTIGQISELTSKNINVLGDVNSLLLMGCWSGVPDQVDQWKTIFPKTRVMGGFVGSAPASTRLAAGTYISGLLRGEKNLPTASTRAQVQSMINQVQNINMMTSSVYIDPNCAPQDRSPAYYYISRAAGESDMPANMSSGLSVYQGTTGQEASCRTMFGEYGSFDWSAALQYFSGDKEPENNTELRSIYSTLRNNEFCFSQNDELAPAVTADQVLFLRFFQDTKKNINKYLEKDIKEMYQELEKIVNASDKQNIKNYFSSHKKLFGESLVGMTRMETTQQVSQLQNLFDSTAYYYPDSPSLPKIRETMKKIDTYLYRLKCLPPTWHEYSEGETLAPPTC